MAQVNARDVVKQTHRTILFELFTDREDGTKKSLPQILETYVEDEDQAGRDIAIRDYLEVSSFEEFLQKFSPTVYEYLEGEGNDKRFIYTTNPKEGEGGRKIEITDHVYFKTLCELYREKGGEGAENVSNIEFEYTSILEKMLSPKAETEEIRKLRRKMEMIAEKRERKLKNLENTDDEVKVLNRLGKEARQKYASVMPLISLAIEDTKKQLEHLSRFTEDKPGAEDGAPAQLMRGTLALGEDGRLEIVPLSSKGEDAAQDRAEEEIKALATERIQKAIGSDFDKHAENKNSFTKELALKAFVPGYATVHNLPATREEAKIVEQKLKNQLAIYNFVYTASKNAFIGYMSELVRKILCVKIFFEHATHTDDPSAEIGKGNLIVTNCKPEQLLDGSIKKAFEDLLGSWGTNNATKVWFGILPGVKNGPDDDVFDSDSFGDEEVITINVIGDREKPTPLNTAKMLLTMMDKAHITTIFNFEPAKDNSFAGISVKNLQATQSNLTSLDGNEHAVYAYPNFTLTNERGVYTDDEKHELITIKSVQIDASYVAAGLLVATQRDTVLKNIGFKNLLLPENVNVRVSLEEDDLASKLLTRFNCELVTSWSPSLKKSIREQQFGFVFCGDQKFLGQDGEPINRSYVLQARSMKKDRKGQYYPIYCTLTKDFIFLYATLKGIDDSKKIMEFLNKDVKAWRDQAKVSPQMINLILQPGEDILLSEENRDVLSVKFNDIEQLVNVKVETNTKN